MVAAIRLRELSAEEQAWIDKLAHSRTAPTRQVERARIIYHASQGLSAPKIAQLLGAEVETVRRWIHRFNRLRKNDFCYSKVGNSWNWLFRKPLISQVPVSWVFEPKSGLHNRHGGFSAAC